jgi:photosystem II stability/assembly factor-like uncharacterized protein
MIVCLSPNGQTTTTSTGPADRLFVGTLRGIHIFRRSGSSATWKKEQESLTNKHVSCLLYEPTSKLLFAGAHGYADEGGLFVSEDEGGTWKECMTGIQSPHIYTIAAQYRDDKAVLYVGTEPPALYRSRDLGKTWEDLPKLREVPGTEKWIFPPPPHIAHVKHVNFHPSQPNTLYALVEQGALLRSTDAGATWHELAGYSKATDSFYRDVHRVAIAASDPKRIHLATGDGLYCSRDGGDTWEHQQRRTDRVGYPDALFLQVGDDNTVYMGGAGDAPETWRTQGGAQAGFIVSHDGGRTWNEAMNGLPSPIIGNIEAMAMHHSPSGTTFFAGTAIGDVFASDDAGKSWYTLVSELPPVSKARHYRHFLSAAEKARIEKEARAEGTKAHA